MQHWGHTLAAALVGVLVVGQIWAMSRFLRDPKSLAPWYNGIGVTQYVAGMMVTASAMGGYLV
jgi:chlorophyll synthase